MPVTVRPDQRLDLHNPSIDEDVARRGGCAEIHLPTGRTCTLGYRHDGSCDFTPRDRVAETLSDRGVGPPS
jgi:hypothetical protein